MALSPSEKPATLRNRVGARSNAPGLSPWPSLTPHFSALTPRLSTLAPRLVLLLAFTLAISAADGADSRPPPSPGVVVKDFTLFDMAGQPVRLSDCHRPVIVLNFWAFWCNTWQAELPQLKELAQQQSTLNFKLLAISVDGQWAEVRRQCPEARRLPFPVLLDGREKLSHELGIRRVPTVMVLDRVRRVTYVHEAYPGNPAVLKAIREAVSADRR